VLLAGGVQVNALPKERYGDSLGGRGTNTQPSNLEADTLPLTYCRPTQKI